MPPEPPVGGTHIPGFFWGPTLDPGEPRNLAEFKAPRGHAVLTSSDPPLSVTAPLAGPARILEGGARYENEPRPGRKSLTRFDGEDPFVIQLPLILDGWSDGDQGRSVEKECRTLEQLMRRHQGMLQPPVVLVFGPVPHTELEWVIDSQRTEWGEPIVRDDNERIRQSVTVVVRQHVKDTGLQGSIDRARERGGRLPAPPVIVKAGETQLRHVLKRLHIRPDPDVLRDWARANDIGVTTPLKRGRRLTRP